MVHVFIKGVQYQISLHINPHHHDELSLITQSKKCANNSIKELCDCQIACTCGHLIDASI